MRPSIKKFVDSYLKENPKDLDSFLEACCSACAAEEERRNGKASLDDAWMTEDTEEKLPELEFPSGKNIGSNADGFQEMEMSGTPAVSSSSIPASSRPENVLGTEVIGQPKKKKSEDHKNLPDSNSNIGMKLPPIKK